MTRLRLTAFAAVALCAAFATADDAPKKAMKIDPDKLVGSYKVVAGLKAGEAMSDDAKKDAIVFTKDKIAVKNNGMDFSFSYKLDLTKDPTEVDLTGVEPEFIKDKLAKGVMKYEGGKIYLAYDPQGEKRPKDFTSTKDNGTFSFELVKEKAGKKKADDKKDD